jgi:hypothetical protein
MSQATTTIPSSNPGTKQFIRQCSLIVGTPQDALELSELRVAFTTTGETLGNPSIAQIHVYNLADTTIAKLMSLPMAPSVSLGGGSDNTAPLPQGIIDPATGGIIPGTAGQVILRAGYAGNFGIIFKGDLMQVRNMWESPTDKYAAILAADGDWGHTWGTMNVTLAAGWTPNDVNDQIKRSLAAYSVAVGDLPDSVPQNPAPRGKVCFGMTRDTIATLKTTHLQDAYVHQGQLQWLPVSAYKPGEAVVINALSGMIGVPMQNEFGIDVECLLNPSIGPGTLIKIDDKAIQRAEFTASTQALLGNAVLRSNLSGKFDGLYKCLAVSHVGDTRGNEWYTRISAMALTQSGATPAVIPPQFAGFPIWQQ